MKLPITLALVLVLAACTEKNPAICCTDEANCELQGLSPDSMCTDGLICRGNQCVAETCTMSSECEAGAPFCAANGLCAMTCESDQECPGFAGAATETFCQGGGCVECRNDADCSGEKPLCDTTSGTCRGCLIDSDCASGACGPTGACLGETDLIYVDVATGADVGQCTKTAPCASVQFGVTTAVLARSHIVLGPGTYTGAISINTGTTSASTVTIHGHGATLKRNNGNDSATIEVSNVGLVVLDTNFVGNGTAGGPLQTGIAPVELHRVKVTNDGQLIVGSNLIIADVEIADTLTNALHIDGASHLSLDRAFIHGGFQAIKSTGAATVSISNLLVHSMSGAALDMTQATGTISYSTIADSAQGAIVGCSVSLKLQADILWTPTFGTPVDAGCSVSATIAGPLGSVGMQTDPMFVNEGARDYHLKAGSPAIDITDSGPSTDLDHISRPQGVRFDTGAYEYKP